MNLDLFGKNAFVGGSSKGIGYAIAHTLADLGANVTLVSRTQIALERIIKDLPCRDGQTHDFMVMDYSNFDEVRSKVESRIKKYKYHILINNTGGPAPGPLMEASSLEFMAIFQQHLVVNQFLSKRFYQGMIDDGYGRIINIISTSVKTPIPNLGVSNTIRSAVATWSKTLANELGQYGITVNSVLPGYIQTERLTQVLTNNAQIEKTDLQNMIESSRNTIPLKRFGEARELANLVGFLASPAASYITGTAIPVDGGNTPTL